GDQLDGKHVVHRRRGVAVEAAEELIRGRSTERLGVLRNDGDRGGEHVRQRDVVEADQGNLVLALRAVERAHAADREQILRREERRRRRRQGEHVVERRRGGDRITQSGTNQLLCDADPGVLEGLGVPTQAVRRRRDRE